MIFKDYSSSVYDTNLKTVLINLFKIYNRFDSNLNLLSPFYTIEIYQIIYS